MSAGWTLRLVCGVCAFLPVLTDARAEILEPRLRDERSLLRPPPADLTLECARIKPGVDRAVFRAVMPPSGKSAWEHSTDVDVDELQSVLWDTAEGLDDVRVIGTYGAARRQIQTYAEAAGSPYDSDRKRAGPKPAAAVPDGLPAEFALYLRGALAYHNGNLDAARESWLKLLELPPTERRHRSVWAAFMLGRCPAPEGVGREWAVGWFERCRELAGDGYTDLLGLAAASYGWEAKLHFDAAEDAAAIDLYLAQLACGDVRAADSLARVADMLFAVGGAQLRRASASPSAVGVLALFAGARGGPHRSPPPAAAVRTWVASLTGRQDLDAQAERIAWAAYYADEPAAAEIWAWAAGPSSGRALWVRSKIHLRNGRLVQAADALHAAFGAFDAPDAARWDLYTALDRIDRGGSFSPAHQCLAEWGLVHLAMGNYQSALAAFVHAGYRDGAEYVAERTLTADELDAFIPAGGGKWLTALPQSKQQGPASGTAALDLKSLLARRFVRLGRWDDARPLFAAAEQAHIDDYRDALRRAADPDAYAEDRAAASWRAARVAHDHGRRLFFRSSSENAFWRDPKRWSSLAGTADESMRRLVSEREEMAPNYPTYVAGTHAWRAAELLPDEDDETARILNAAGRWYAVSDNARADQFYKALVRRCGTTKVGRAADGRGWFVP